MGKKKGGITAGNDKTVLYLFGGPLPVSSLLATLLSRMEAPNRTQPVEPKTGNPHDEETSTCKVQAFNAVPLRPDPAAPKNSKIGNQYKPTTCRFI